MSKKGVLLSGGTGSRLAPMNSITNKQLLPINKRPIIDYPINTLMNLGCTHITVILGDTNFQQVVSYLKNGSHRGVHFNFIYQDSANGIAAAINLCEPYFRDEESFSVLLGDNIFEKPFKWSNSGKAEIALISSPEILRFGVASIDKDKIIKIEEKPKQLSDQYSHYAMTGAYKFTHKFFDYFKELKPSWRNEFEVSEVLAKYLANDDLNHQFVDGFWIDAGTFPAIDSAREMVKLTGLEDTLK